MPVTETELISYLNSLINQSSQEPTQPDDEDKLLGKIPNAFIDFVTSNIFNIIGGTGEVDNPLVLEVVKGTEADVIKSLLAKYSNYDLTITSKEKTGTIESYILTFTKGEESVVFEIQVPVTETELISYLNNLINQSGEKTDQDDDESEDKPNVEKPTIQENNNTTQRPQTGLSGLLGFVGISTLSLGAVFSKRKKK